MTRSAPFLLGVVVFVAEPVGFKLAAVSVCEALAAAVLYKTGKRCQTVGVPS